MGKIIKLDAESVLKKAKALDVGEYFNFAMDAECDGEPQTEADPAEWYGVQKLYLFGSEMVLIAKHGGTACEVISTEHLTDCGIEMLETDFAYIVDEAAQKQELTINLTPGFCIDIRNGTNSGENVFIPPRKAHELEVDIDRYNVSADITVKAVEQRKLNDITPERALRMAETVIDRRDDCCIISEAYWQIVEEVIEEFFKDEQQKA